MCEWEWTLFLKETARKYQLSLEERDILLLIQKDYSTRRELWKKVEKQLETLENTFANQMKRIYKKLQIEETIENQDRRTPNKFIALKQKLDREFEQRSIKPQISAIDAGITQIYKNFPYDKFKQALDRVIKQPDAKNKQVDILQTFAPNLNDFKAELINCIRNDVSVRIVLIWPHSTVARLREDVLKINNKSEHSYESIRFDAAVRENLQILESIIKHKGLKNPERFLQIRLYDTIPSIALYRAGNYLLASCFFHGQLAINTFQLEMNLDANNPLIINTFQKDFDLMFELSKDFTDSLANNYWRNDLEHLFL